MTRLPAIARAAIARRGSVASCRSTSAMHADGEITRRRDEHDLCIRAVLGLRKQVGCDEPGTCRIVRDDQHFRRAGGHVERCAIGVCGDDLLGGGDPRIAGAEDLVHFGHRRRAVRHRGHRLSAAELEYLVDAAQSGHRQHGGVREPVRPGRRAEHADTAAGQPRRHGQHDRGRGERGSPRRNVEAHGVQRHEETFARDSLRRLHACRFQ